MSRPWSSAAVSSVAACSGGYTHYVDRSEALAYLPAELAQADGSFEIEIRGDRRPARLQAEPLFDPKRERMLG